MTPRVRILGAIRHQPVDRLPPEELKQVVWQRIQQAAPDGRRLAFEVSE
jgi:hypothetical protein